MFYCLTLITIIHFIVFSLGPSFARFHIHFSNSLTTFAFNTRDHVGFLRNCRETLRAEGVLIMSEPCIDNPLIRLARVLLYKKSPHFDEGDQGFTRKGIVGLCEQAGFEVQRVRKYGVLAYVFAGFPDHLGILRWIPGNAWITRAMIRIDQVLCALPVLSLLGFHVVVVARPAR